MAISSRTGGQRNFGRREVERPAVRVRASASASIVVHPTPPVVAPAVRAAPRFFFPYLTAGLVAILTAIFLCELRVSTASGGILTIDGNAYVSLGGIGRALFLQQH